VHVIEEEESSGAAAEIQVSEPINIAGASVEQEVDEVVVVVISEDHVVAPWGHHEDPLGTPEAGPQQLADAVVATISILYTNIQSIFICPVSPKFLRNKVSI